MDKLLVKPGNPLEGQIQIAGAKNAALPIMMAALMTDETIELKRIPHLLDITRAIQLVASLGVATTLKYEGEMSLLFDASKLTSVTPEASLVQSMRASIMLLGPLLARHGEVKLYHPGGCVIGSRPIDIHLQGLCAMGAEITEEDDMIIARANKLKGIDFTFPVVTVTGTENLICAATLAEGTTILRDAAQEPEVTDLIHCLNGMGADIQGEGTSTIQINGVSKLHGIKYTVMPDRIEAATYLTAAAITRGSISINEVNASHLNSVLDKLSESGAQIDIDDNQIHLTMNGKQPKAVDIFTSPFPGFPTDMQAQFVALNSTAKGSSLIVENVFENRFHHVAELCKMGAKLQLNGNQLRCQGTQLKGAEITASDLRASACLVLAGLVAEGSTIIHQVQHIDRGYELIEEKLSRLGANIYRIHSNQDIPTLKM